MAGFDPDAYLAKKRAPAAAGSFDPDAYLAEKRVGAVAVEAPGLGASFARGAAQGITLGFADEIAGLVESAFTGKTYRQARDESRAAFARAQLANPKAYFAGEIGSALVPGLGAAKAIKAGGTALQAGLRAAKIGGLSGAGASEADLTRGDVGGLARDVAIGGAASGVLGAGAVKLFGGAPERVLRRTAKDIVSGEASAGLRVAKKFGQRAGGEELDVLREALEAAPKMRRVLATTAVTNPTKAAARISQRMDEIGPKLGAIHDQIDEKVGGVAARAVADRLDAAVLRFREAGDDTMARAAETVRERFTDLFGDKGYLVAFPPGKRIPARALRNFANNVGETAFAKDPLVSRPIKARAQQLLYGDLVKAIEEAAEKAGASVTDLRRYNREMAMWIPARAALLERAEKEAVGRSSLTTNLLRTALVGGGFAGGGPAGALAGAAAAAARPVGGRILRESDYQLALLLEAARRGDPRAQRLLGGLQTAGTITVGSAAGRAMNPPSIDKPQAR